MPTTAPETSPQKSDAERTIDHLEARLAALADALRAHRPEAVQDEAAELQRALAAALEPLRRGALAGALPPAQRQRLAAVASRMSAQRDALARAGGGLDRALNLLLPEAAASGAYSPTGSPARQVHSGWAQA